GYGLTLDVVGDHRMAGGDQPRRHGLSHAADADEANRLFFLRHLGPPVLAFAAFEWDDGRGCRASLASWKEQRMEFGILFTSHANDDTEPYPRRDVHARVTREI